MSRSKVLSLAGCLVILNTFSLVFSKVAVFLNGSSSNLQGSVTLSFDDGEPRSLAVGLPDWSVSGVLCRHIGSGPLIATSSSRSEENAEYRQYYDAATIHCHGYEASLDDCKIFNRTLLLVDPKILEVQCAPPVAEEFDVTLARPHKEVPYGTVLTYIDGRWGTISQGNHNSNEVLCRQLGYYSIVAPSSGIIDVQVFEATVLDSLSCHGDEESIEECSYTRADQSNASGGQDPLKASCWYFDVGENNSSNASLSEHPIYRQAYFDPHGPMKVLFISVVMTTSFIFCLWCGSKERSDHSDMDLGNPAEVAHRFQRYHAGSGPGYYPVPCSISQTLPDQGSGFREQRIGYHAGNISGFHGHARSTLPSQGGQTGSPNIAGTPEDDPPEYQPPGQHLLGIQSFGNLGGAPSAYQHDGDPRRVELGNQSRTTQEEESPACHHNSDTRRPNLGGGNIPSASTDGGSIQEPPAFQPGSGTNYPSVPPSSLELAMDGGGSTVWPDVTQRCPIVSPPGMGVSVVSGRPSIPNDDLRDPELPSYTEAVFRSSIQY